MPTAFMVTGCTRGKRRTSTRACARQIAPPTTASADSKGTFCGNGEREITATREGEQGSYDPRDSEVLLPPEHREQESGRWHKRQQDLAESGMYLDEPVVDQPERGADIEQAVEQRAQQCTSARERQPEDDHDSQEQGSRQRESQTGTPQWCKLPVAEPDAHRIATGEHGVGHECGECHPLAMRGGHKPDATPLGLVTWLRTDATGTYERYGRQRS
jgi:hypothetical protein